MFGEGRQQGAGGKEERAEHKAEYFHDPCAGRLEQKEEFSQTHEGENAHKGGNVPAAHDPRGDEHCRKNGGRDEPQAESRGTKLVIHNIFLL